MIKGSIELSPESRRILSRMDRWPERTAAALVAALDLENELTVGHLQATKLSRRGPRTLGVRTNRLRLSVRTSPARVTEGIRITSSIGSNVEYFAVHEFGFHGTVTVRQHARRITQAFGRPLSARTATVRTHTRRVDFPARRMLARSLTERRANYTASLSAALERSAPQ
jgi:phage gpG-like protein